MTCMDQTADQVIDLAIRTDLAMLDGHRHPLRAKLSFEISEQGDRGVFLNLDGEDHLISWVILKAGAAESFIKIFLQPVNRSQNGDRQPFYARRCRGLGLMYCVADTAR